MFQKLTKTNAKALWIIVARKPDLWLTILLLHVRFYFLPSLVLKYCSLQHYGFSNGAPFSPQIILGNNLHFLKDCCNKPLKIGHCHLKISKRFSQNICRKNFSKILMLILWFKNSRMFRWLHFLAKTTFFWTSGHSSRIRDLFILTEIQMTSLSHCVCFYIWSWFDPFFLEDIPEVTVFGIAHIIRPIGTHGMSGTVLKLSNQVF